MVNLFILTDEEWDDAMYGNIIIIKVWHYAYLTMMELYHYCKGLVKGLQYHNNMLAYCCGIDYHSREAIQTQIMAKFFKELIS